MFTIKRGIFANKGDNSKFTFARIMPLFRLRIFSEKAATAERCHQHAVLLFFILQKDEDNKQIPS